MSHIFKILPAGSAALFTLSTILLFCLGLTVVLGWWGKTQPALLATMVITLAISGIFLWFIVGQRQSTLQLSPQQLTLQAPMYGRTIPMGEVLANQVEQITLNRQSPYWLTWRMNGLSVPGYDLGWFQTRAKGKVLAALTSDQAIAIPTSKGYILLVSVKDADTLAVALKTLPPQSS